MPGKRSSHPRARRPPLWPVFVGGPIGGVCGYFLVTGWTWPWSALIVLAGIIASIAVGVWAAKE